MQNNILIVNKLKSGIAEILLYGFIGKDELTASAFVRELMVLEKDHNKINIRINSAGGSVFDGIAIYNAILSSTSEIDTYIDGIAASMASVIALAGRRIYMSHNATYMTHLPSTYAGGSSEQIKRSANLLESLEKTMLSIYAARTGKTDDECKAKFMNGADNWFTAEQAVAEGLVDEVFQMAHVKAPVKLRNERAAYMEYAAMLTDNTKNKNENMEQIILSAEQLAQLPGMNAGAKADQTQVDAAFNELIAKAAQADQLQASLNIAKADLKKEQDAFIAFKEAATAATITAMLEDANVAGKTTVEQNKILAATYKGNPEGLTAWLDTLQPQQRVVPELAATDELAKMSWDELDKAGKLEKLKAENIDLFKAKYKAQFEKEYAE